MRVRLREIADLDLSLFEFDYDLTMMVFFLSADERIYGRFGGRDATNADARQSLAGLHYAMQAALDTHHRDWKDATPQEVRRPTYYRDLVAGRRPRGCVHCHQIKEATNDNLKRQGMWNRDHIWRFPLPDNLGFVLEVCLLYTSDAADD